MKFEYVNIDLSEDGGTGIICNANGSDLDSEMTIRLEMVKTWIYNVETVFDKQAKYKVGMILFLFVFIPLLLKEKLAEKETLLFSIFSVAVVLFALYIIFDLMVKIPVFERVYSYFFATKIKSVLIKQINNYDITIPVKNKKEAIAIVELLKLSRN